MKKEGSYSINQTRRRLTFEKVGEYPAIYYSCKKNGIEICLEPCLNGYDVAVYDNAKNLLEAKICTNLDMSVMESDTGEVFSTSGQAMLKAMDIADELYERHK